MRQFINDEEFHREREALTQRRRDLELPSVGPAPATDGREERLREVRRQIDLTQGGPLVLAKGTPVQVRSLLQGLQLEIVLRGRRLDISVTEPLSQLVKAGSDSNWCTRWPDIWKWITFGDHAAAMNISPGDLHLMMGGDERSVKMVERAQKRASGGQELDERRGSK
jgi:hypothetical protein